MEEVRGDCAAAAISICIWGGTSIGRGVVAGEVTDTWGSCNDAGAELTAIIGTESRDYVNVRKWYAFTAL